MKKVLFLVMACVMMLTGFQLPVSGKSINNFSVKNEYRKGQYTDIKATEWYASNVQRCYELGLMQGKTEGLFDPKGKITLAEVIAIAARAHEIYYGGDGNIPSTGTTWYDGAVDYAIENSTIKEGDFSNYKLNATRGQVAYIFANILPRSEFIELNFIDGLPDVYFDVPYSQPTFFLYQSGVLTGSDQYGTFYEDSYITRAEAASLIIRIVSPADRITYAPNSLIFQGNLPNDDPYSQFRYFTNADNGPAPVLDYSKIKIANIQNPYDNGNNNPSEFVTKSEGIKVILSMTLGTADIGDLEQKLASTYENAVWVEYAQEQGLIDAGAITPANEATPITLQETIDCLMAALKKFAPEVDFGFYGRYMLLHFDGYSDTTRHNTYFAYYWDLLGDRTDLDLINLQEQMTKAKMDRLLTDTVNKLNVINGKKSQIKTTDLPKNADAYPYILAGIENEVYEMPFSGWDSAEASPRICFKGTEDLYERFDQMISEAYSDFVNIDYETISVDSFSNAKEWSLDYACGWVDELDDRIESYIDYVKKNKIKITGKVTPLLPIVYHDGFDFRIRTKIEYTIISSDTNVDLLLGDRIAYSGSTKLGYSPTIYKSKKIRFMLT